MAKATLIAKVTPLYGSAPLTGSNDNKQSIVSQGCLISSNDSWLIDMTLGNFNSYFDSAPLPETSKNCAGNGCYLYFGISISNNLRIKKMYA